MATVESFKADVSSVSTSSERIKIECNLLQSATTLLQIETTIFIKFDRYYKVRRLLQSAIEKNPEQHNIFINQTYYLQKELKAVYCYALGIHLFILPIVIVYNSHLFHTCYWY